MGDCLKAIVDFSAILELKQLSELPLGYYFGGIITFNWRWQDDGHAKAFYRIRYFNTVSIFGCDRPFPVLKDWY